MKMKKKILFSLNFLWSELIAFTFPICLAWIWMDITGHAKGYDYDLGSEKDISVMMGGIELLIWLILAVPSNVILFLKLKEKHKLWSILTIILSAVLMLLCIEMIGGFHEYGRCFHP